MRKCFDFCNIVLVENALFEPVAVTETGRSDFFYLIVFSCALPAFFEEWLFRGGVLGALSPHGATGVWCCSLLFMLIHAPATRWFYAIFAGFLITALVYLTECVYLGMFLHFVNNLFSVILSSIKSETAEYIALGVIFAVFCCCFAFLSKTDLWKDVRRIFSECKREKLYKLCTPIVLTFVFCMLALNVISVF